MCRRLAGVLCHGRPAVDKLKPAFDAVAFKDRHYERRIGRGELGPLMEGMPDERPSVAAKHAGRAGLADVRAAPRVVLFFGVALKAPCRKRLVWVDGLVNVVQVHVWVAVVAIRRWMRLVAVAVVRHEAQLAVAATRPRKNQDGATCSWSGARVQRYSCRWMTS